MQSAMAASAPLPAKAGGGSAPVNYSIFPRNLTELRTYSRDFGDAAVTEARWLAIGVWLMKGDNLACLSNPLPVVRVATTMVQEHDRYRLGWPCWQGKEAERAAPLFTGLSPESQCEAKLVAAQTVVDWETAGSPWLDANRIKQVYAYVTSCPAYLIKYSADNGVPHFQLG